MKYKCNICGYVYDEKEGDAFHKIKEGTLFSSLPDSWSCPVCDAEKSSFAVIDEKKDQNETIKKEVNKTFGQD